MLTGFEDLTVELDDFELGLVDKFVKGLSRRVGKKNAISNKAIRKSMINRYGIKINDTRIRKIVQYLRVNGLVVDLIATNSGYYVAENEEEYNRYIQSLNERIRSIQYTKVCMEHYHSLVKLRAS